MSNFFTDEFLLLYVGVAILVITTVAQLSQANFKNQRFTIILSFCLCMLIPIITFTIARDKEIVVQVNNRVTKENHDLLEEMNKVRKDQLLQARQVAAIQEERRKEILGGEQPPKLEITSKAAFEVSTVTVDGGEAVDTIRYFVDLIFDLRNDSPEHLKSVSAFISGIDYYGQAKLQESVANRKTVTKADLFSINRPEFSNYVSLGILGAEMRSKTAFVLRVPLNTKEVKYRLDVEWSNGYYSAEVVLKETIPFSRRRFDARKYAFHLYSIRFDAPEKVKNKIEYDFKSVNDIRFSGR